MNVKDIVKILKEWNDAYRDGKPIVSDSIYDNMLDMLPDNHEFKNKVEPEELYKGRIKHNKPMLSMQKAKTEKDMQKWVDKVLSYSYNKEIIIKCTAKLDGIAGKIEDKKFVTRGDGKYGNDVTNCLEKGINVSDFIISNPTLGEFVVELDYFKEKLSSEFSDPRSFVSGAIMSETLNSITKQAFNSNAIIFQTYSDLPAKKLPILSLIENFREAEETIRASVNYEIDGVIFEVMNKDLKDLMGATEHHPNWAIALKPEDKVYQSEIIDIIWQTGRTGKVTPVVLIKPTNIEGVIVKRATAHNAKMVETLGLDIGIKIDLIRSGSVIPYIIGVSK